MASDGGAACSTLTKTWRINNFSKLTDERVHSECFEAGINTWRLFVFSNGDGPTKGTHLSVFLEAQDTMSQTQDTGKLSYIGAIAVADIELSVLRDGAAGWLVKDTLVLKVDVTVTREDRFQLDTGGVPCDVTLKLPCGAKLPAVSHLFKMAVPCFREVLEDVTGSGLIPVDGSLGTWTYILTNVHHQRDPPTLDLRSIYMLLPTVHKYNFKWLLARLMAFIKESRVELS
ncbi:hypothetical protein FOA52_006713 [Chlamydomonas sp. UWO 241]|nr:hypothetical protein FOA52_006713 [Chlamydomonas sp. UWO 241]